MSRETARLDKNDIEAQIERCELRISPEEMRGGALETALLARQDRFHRLARPSRLYLDDGERAAAADHHVNFACRRLQPAGEDAIALEAKKQDGQSLGAKAGPVGGAARGGVAAPARHLISLPKVRARGHRFPGGEDP